MRMKISKY